MKKLKSIVGALGISAVTLIGSSASATTYRLQPASGAPFLTSGGANWEDINDEAFNITDGRSVGLTGLDGAWVTPIPVDATNTTWNIKQWVSTGTGTISTRICSFTKEGVFSNCSSGTTASNVTRSVFVPTDGTAYAQSTFDSSCRDDCTEITLHTIRAWN